MIYIFEDTRQKLSGVTSLFIASTYNPEVVSAIKTAETYFFHKDKHLWEIPLTSLAKVLDALVLIDDVTLIVKEDEESKEEILPDSDFKTTPRDYQMEGIVYGINHDKFLLLDEPGLGKSLEIIYIAEELKRREGIEHCLIICGLASLRTNWLKEINKHSKLSGRILGARINRNNNLVWDSIAKRAETLRNPIDDFFVIVNIETMRYDDVIEAIKKGPNKFAMMAIDEGHCIKSWKSIQGNNLLELDAKHKIVATGTPLLNSPLDTYMMLTWIDKESKRGITKFKDTFCVQEPIFQNGKMHPFKKRVVGYKNLDLLQSILDSCSIRRTKDILNLPEKTTIDEELVMNDSHADFYKKIKDSVNKESRQEGIDACDKIRLKPNLIRAFITRLRQATSCPGMLTSQNVNSCKIERAVELAKEIIANNEKVVIFSEFKEPVYQLRDLLKEYNPLIGTGDIPEGEFSSNIDKFQNDDKYKVFIGTTAKCGTGITLTSASYMIFIDQPWTWGAYEQAQDRIHRIGAKKPVFYYNLICKDTIDEMVSAIINKKKALGDFIIDEIDEGETLNAIRRYILDI